MKKISAIYILFALTFCTPQELPNPATKELPAGVYELDKSHASLIFRVNHLGFSYYTARFKRFDATLQFDPANPDKSSVSASIDPSSIETDYPNSEKLNFNTLLQNEQWLDALRFPAINFNSTRIELTGTNTARIIGELELHGVKRPMILEVKFNGGYAGNPMDPSGSRIGFSARGALKRSDFGIIFGIPEKGSSMGVSDKVEIILEVEFTKPTTNKNS